MDNKKKTLRKSSNIKKLQIHPYTPVHTKPFLDFENMIELFLWNGKPRKFRTDIMEADIKDGGLGLQNLKLFDLSLKIGWPKRYLKNRSQVASCAF